jgi:hypothetical protein
MKTLLLVYLCASGADAASTRYALDRGANEALLTQNHAANYVIIAGQAGIVTYGVFRYAERHPKLAKVVMIGLLAFKSYVVVSNVRAGRISSGGSR